MVRSADLPETSGGAPVAPKPAVGISYSIDAERKLCLLRCSWAIEARQFIVGTRVEFWNDD
jgi:hypothetical protein